MSTIIKGPLVWDQAILEKPDSFTLSLTETDLVEIKSALTFFKDLGLGYDGVNRDTFPLPGLSARLETAKSMLHNGHGFFVIHGMNIDHISAEDSAIVFIGIASYIGNKLGYQDSKGNVLSHITDSKKWTVPQNMRHGIHSNKALPFHNDMGCDTLCIQVRECAKTGGGTYLSSAYTAIKDLAKREPQVLKALFSHAWPVQVSGKAAKYFLAPLMQVHGGHILTSVDPGRVGPQARTSSSSESVIEVNQIPNLSTDQEEAMNALLDSAKQNEIRVPLKKGDMLFLNNWAILHRRDAYQDGSDTSRHLVRLWIRDDQDGWAVPEEMATPFNTAYQPREMDKLFAIHPMAEYKVPKYSAGSAAFVIDDDEDEN